MKKIYINVDTHQEFQNNTVWTDYLIFLKSIQDKGFQLAFKDGDNSADFNIGVDLSVNH